MGLIFFSSLTGHILWLTFLCILNFLSNHSSSLSMLRPSDQKDWGLFVCSLIDVAVVWCRMSLFPSHRQSSLWTAQGTLPLCSCFMFHCPCHLCIPPLWSRLSLNDGRWISMLGCLSVHSLLCFVMKHVLGIIPIIFILNACYFISAVYDSSCVLSWL